ncbi:MAG: peptidylprolyl isomerase [Lachnospiraceae bacterium]
MEKKRMVITMKNGGSIVIELLPGIAPVACGHVMKMIEMKKYDGKKIERLEPGFVIQPLFQDGLDADIDKMVEPEFKTNPENAAMKYVRGTVGMAGFETAASGSQFFITLQEAERLNGNFTVIGQVVDGWEEIERLESVEVLEQVDPSNGFVYHIPVKDEVVESIRLDD